jgi:hypothetical protein
MTGVYTWNYAEEQRRGEELEQESQRWHRSRLVREYLAAVKETALREHAVIDPGSELDRWLAWAHRYADRLDPLDRSLVSRRPAVSAARPTPCWARRQPAQPSPRPFLWLLPL